MLDYILEMKHISKEYGGIKALDDVSLSVKKGEILCLCGENGAGKSTLMKVLTGIVIPEHGEICISGKTARIQKPLDAYHYGISIVHQELVQIPKMTIAENIYIGRYDLKFGLIDYKALQKKVLDLMGKIGINFDPNTLINNCSIAQRQLIEILKALSYNSRIIVLDEPTAALTIEETKSLYEIVRKLKAQGVSIIFISHRMEDIFAIGDRVYVLRDGRYSGEAAVSKVTETEIVRMMIGRELETQYPERTSQPGETILEIKNMTNQHIRNISFSVRSGEVLGIGGLIGAGRTELLRTLFGIDKYEGTVVFRGKEIRNRSPKEAIERGFAMVPEDRKDVGLILSHSIRNNVLITVLDKISRFGFIRRKEEIEVSERYISELNIKTPGSYLKVGALSGGNQQKVVIAKALASGPMVVLLDEPTRGVDVGAKAEIYKIINDLTTRGYAVIMVSSELPELIAVSDRIVVMHEGHMSGEVNAEDATEEILMNMAIR